MFLRSTALISCALLVSSCIGAAANSRPSSPPQGSAPQDNSAAGPWIDLPPAAPGFPPLHTTDKPADGCHWAPYVSPRFGLEMLIEACAPGKMPNGLVTYQQTETGIRALADGSVIEQFLTVYSKPADQSIADALENNFILKDKDPLVRAHCKPVLAKDSVAPVETYQILPVGAYAHLKRFNRADNESDDPCPGLGSDDAVGRSYLYIPSDSREKYILFASEDSIPFSPDSIRFGPEGVPMQASPTPPAAAVASPPPPVLQQPQQEPAPPAQRPNKHTIVLTPEQPSASRLTMIVAPGSGRHFFNLLPIDLQQFPNGGLIDIRVDVLPGGRTAGSFDVYPGNDPMAAPGLPVGQPLAWGYDVPPGRTAVMDLRFTAGSTLLLGLEGNWGSPHGAFGLVRVRITVTPQ